MPWAVPLSWHRRPGEPTKIYAEIPRGWGYVLRVTGEPYQEHERANCRIWYESRPGGRDTLRPTPKGLNVGLRDLPPLVVALQAAGADGLKVEHLPLRRACCVHTSSSILDGGQQ